MIDEQELCRNCGNESADLDIGGVCPKCQLDLTEEAELQRQEDIDEHDNQRMADCADVCGVTHFELFELGQRPDYFDDSEGAK